MTPNEFGEGPLWICSWAPTPIRPRVTVSDSVTDLIVEHFAFDLNIDIESISTIFVKMSYRYRIGLEKSISNQLYLKYKAPTT